MDRSGFTLVELVVAIFLLTLGVLGLGASASRLTTVAFTAEQEALAFQAANDRIAAVLLHPAYPELNTVFSGTEVDPPGYPGFTRTTQVTRVQLPGSGGRTVEYTRISVSVQAPRLAEPLVQTAVVAPR